MRSAFLSLVAALLFLSAPSAAALPEGHVELEGGGSGEVVGVSGPTGGTPRIECRWNGETEQQTGICDTEAGEELGIIGLSVEHREAPGSEFGGWTIEEGIELGGSCSAFSRGCGVLSFGTPIRIKAVFATGPVVRFHLTAAKTGTGAGLVASIPPGINCAPSCAKEGADFLEGQVVTVTATPDADSRFEAWSNCDAEPSPGVCEVTMSEARQVEAEFSAIPLVPLTVVKRGHPEGGTVTSVPTTGIDCGPGCVSATGEFKEGQSVVLNAQPEQGYAFMGWRGCTHAVGGECKVEIGSEASEVKAIFAKGCRHRGPHHPWRCIRSGVND